MVLDVPGIAFYIVAAPLDVRRKMWVGSVYESIRGVVEELGVKLGFKAVVKPLVTSSNYIPEAIPGIDGVVVIVLSGGTDRMVFNIVSNLRLPALVYAHPGENSLASVREAIAALRERGFEVTVSYGKLEELGVKIKEWLSAVTALSSLRGARLGLVGEPEPWLLNIRDPDVIRERFGVEVIKVDWSSMLERALKVGDEVVESKVLELKKLFPVVEVGDEDLRKAVRIYYGLRGLVEELRLDALAVEARDMLVEDLRDYGPYLAVSLLSAEGIPADYEVDVEAILTKLLVYKLTRRSSFMANLTRVNLEKNSVTLSHCTVPLDMIDVSKSRLTTYFETGRTVAIRGKMREGERVTILRLGGPKLDRMLVAKGVIVNGDIGDPSLCRTQIEVKIEGNPMMLIEESIGNHMIVVYGDLSKELEALARIAKITLLQA